MSQTPDTAKFGEIGSRTRLLCTNTPCIALPQREAVDMQFWVVVMLWIFSIIYYPDAQCMVYLPTFTINLGQM